MYTLIKNLICEKKIKFNDTLIFLKFLYIPNLSKHQILIRKHSYKINTKDKSNIALSKRCYKIIVAMKEKRTQNYIISISYSIFLVSMTKFAEIILNHIKFSC